MELSVSASICRYFVLELYEGCNHNLKGDRVYATSSHPRRKQTKRPLIPPSIRHTYFLGILVQQMPMPRPSVAATRSVVAEPSPRVRRIKPPRPTVSQAPQPACFQLPTVDKLSTTNLLPLPSKAKSCIADNLDTPNAIQSPHGTPRTRTHSTNRHRTGSHPAVANVTKPPPNYLPTLG
jgi:hypothetical protein